jgi:hypothetical protein
MEGGGDVLRLKVNGGEYVLTDSNGYKRTFKNADWKPFLNSHKSRATTPWKHYTFAFEPDHDFVLCTDTIRRGRYCMYANLL